MTTEAAPSAEGRLPAFMTTQEVSRLLRLPPSTLTRYAREGRIEAYRPGRCWLFPRSGIRPFLESGVRANGSFR
jgi:excisionase family DNA binding protein